MKKIISAAGLAILASTATAQNVGQLYGEVSYQTTSVKDTSSNNLGKFKTNGISLGLGYVVIDNLAIEGFYNLASSTASNTYANGDTLVIKFKPSYSVSLRPFINVTNNIELFARVGRSFAKGETNYIENNIPKIEADDQYHNFFGLGVAYKINKDASIVADYKRLSGLDELSGSTISVGLRYNF